MLVIVKASLYLSTRTAIFLVAPLRLRRLKRMIVGLGNNKTFSLTPVCDRGRNVLWIKSHSQAGIYIRSILNLTNQQFANPSKGQMTSRTLNIFEENTVVGCIYIYIYLAYTFIKVNSTSLQTGYYMKLRWIPKIDNRKESCKTSDEKVI